MKEFKDTHLFLKNKFKEYISLIAIGSITNDDNWIEGRSDKDILIIFESYPKKYISILNDYLKTTHFNDSYTFVPMLKNNWIKNKRHSHDFSGKFRSKTIYGINLIPEKQIPSKEDAYNIYTKGLEDVKYRITRTIVNEGIWSDKKLKNIFWKLFKHAFMYLAIKYYHDTDTYPNSRNKIVEVFKEPILEETLNILNNIDNEEKKNIINISSKLLEYLNSL